MKKIVEKKTGEKYASKAAKMKHEKSEAKIFNTTNYKSKFGPGDPPKKKSTSRDSKTESSILKSLANAGIEYKNPLSNTSKNKNSGGTHLVFNNGRVGRTYPNGPYESMDTTGYSKGKKEFDLIQSYAGKKPLSEKVQRKDVNSKLNEFASGATRFEDYRRKPKK